MAQRSKLQAISYGDTVSTCSEDQFIFGLVGLFVVFVDKNNVRPPQTFIHFCFKSQHKYKYTVVLLYLQVVSASAQHESC